MPHQLELKYLSTKPITSSIKHVFQRVICRNDNFKLLLKTHLKELFTNQSEILFCKSVKPCKNRKNSRAYYVRTRENPVQIPHPFNETFKFPPPRARCTVKCPGYARGGGRMVKFRIDRCISFMYFLLVFRFLICNLFLICYLGQKCPHKVDQLWRADSSHRLIDQISRENLNLEVMGYLLILVHDLLGLRILKSPVGVQLINKSFL